jgi:hypothetical protein
MTLLEREVIMKNLLSVVAAVALIAGADAAHADTKAEANPDLLALLSEHQLATVTAGQLHPAITAAQAMHQQRKYYHIDMAALGVEIGLPPQRYALPREFRWPGNGPTGQLGF